MPRYNNPELNQTREQPALAEIDRLILISTQDVVNNTVPMNNPPPVIIYYAQTLIEIGARAGRNVINIPLPEEIPSQIRRNTNSIRNN